LLLKIPGIRFTCELLPGFPDISGHPPSPAPGIPRHPDKLKMSFLPKQSLQVVIEIH
jgi:hypothetical protein